MSKQLDFTHTHLHSEYSLLDGANKVADIPKIAKEYGMSAISITDHGNLAGALEFYRECKKLDVKPIIGMEAYITMDEDGLPKDKMSRDNYHMILLASNEEGYNNLLYLTSNAHQNNYYYRPRISFTQLAQHAKGLIGSSACLAGVCSRSATYDEVNKVYTDPTHNAERTLDLMKEIFSGRFYLELMDNSMDQQKAYNKFLLDMSKRTSTKLVISSDAHYTRKDDEELHTLLMAMQSKKTVEQYKADGYFHYENCYIRPPEEMLEAAKRIGSEEAFHNTSEIASLCNLDIRLGEYKIPHFDITKDPDWKEFVSTGE